MKHGSLFSGIGGFDLAARWMGWENVFNCEIDLYCRNILKKHFKDSIQHADIRTTDFTVYRGQLSVLSGGFPCQDISVANSTGREGLSGSSSGLWYQMLRAVREIRPLWVVIENVYGLITQDGGLAIETVCAGLEGEGYEVLPPIVISAVATGANHIRKRVWIVAHATGLGDGLSQGEVQAGRNVTEYRVGWNTEPGVCRVYDGLPKGLDKRRLRGLGNAIRPQIAYEIFKIIDLVETKQAITI